MVCDVGTPSKLTLNLTFGLIKSNLKCLLFWPFNMYRGDSRAVTVKSVVADPNRDYSFNDNGET